jgi:SAM-dependent methyltransferase
VRRKALVDDRIWLDINKKRWDERVGIHLESDFYDLAAFRDGKDPLLPFEAAELGDVSGKNLLHLQCHIGTDTLSWSRRGARVVGTDFSGAAIRAARALAVDIGDTTSEFFVADTYGVRETLSRPAPFDVIYTGKGSINWLPHLEPWAETIATMLSPGGVFYMVEFHPVANVIDEKTCRTVQEDYFRQGPIRYELTGTYSDKNAATTHNRGVEWQHTLGDVVSALATVGLRLDFLHERPLTTFGYFGEALIAHPEGYWTYPEEVPRLPLSYSLRATR